MKLVDSQGRPIRLGGVIGSGGEGDIHDVAGSPDRVAKLYRPGVAPPDPEKLRCLIAENRDALLQIAAWPISTLHERSVTGPIVGYIMPKLSGYEGIHTLYSPDDRLNSYPDADWRTLVLAAINCSIAFEAVHQHGFLVADVNESNVRVAADAAVRLIDCDSFQVRTADGRVFRCGVGRPEFTAPELQPHRLADVDREENHDRFGLAVLIFQLLFMGRHPYSGVNPGSVGIPIGQAIRENRFAYSRNRSTSRSSPPPGAPTLDAVPFSLAALLERAFAPPGTQGERPSAGEWRSALTEFLAQLQPCQSIRTHYYHPVTKRCPWCELTAKHRVRFFRHVPVPSARRPQPVPKPAAPTIPPQTKGVAYQIVFTLLLIGMVVLAIGRRGSTVVSLQFDSLLREASGGDVAARARIREFGPPAIYSLAKELDAEDPAIARTAVEILDEIDPNWRANEGARRAVPELAAGLESEYEDVICRSLRALRRTGSAAAVVTPRLLGLLLLNANKYKEGNLLTIQAQALDVLQGIDPNWHSSKECEQVVGQLAGQLEQSRHRVAGARPMGDPSENHVASVLGLLGPAARAATPGLIVSLFSEDAGARVSAREALNRINPNWQTSTEAKQTIPRLVALMKSSNSDSWQRLVLHEFIEKVEPSFHFDEVDRETAQKPNQTPGLSGMNSGSTVVPRRSIAGRPPGVIVVPPPEMRASPHRRPVGSLGNLTPRPESR